MVEDLLITSIAFLALFGIIVSDNKKMIEHFGDVGSNNYHIGSNKRKPSMQDPKGNWSLSKDYIKRDFKVYQQSINSVTPSLAQLMKAQNFPSGGMNDLVNNSEIPGIVPFAGEGTLYDAAKVDFGNRRSDLISPCAQNAPTFVASSLLPRINLPGVPTFEVNENAALANQDFLTSSQQIGVDTVLGTNRNANYDIRRAPIIPIRGEISPWMNSTIGPDLLRRPLECTEPYDGIYGCFPGESGCMGMKITQDKNMM